MTPAARSRMQRSGLPALTVQGWFRLVFVVIAVLVIAAGIVIAYLLAMGRTVSGELEGGILPAEAQAYRLQGALVDQETGVRGYGITGDPSFLQPYTAGLATQASAASRLQGLIGRKPVLAADLRNLQRAASGWQASYATPLIALAKKGPLSGRDLGLLLASKHSFDHLRVLFAVQNAHLAAAARRDRAGLNSSRAVIDWTFTGIFVIFLLAAAVMAVVLQKAVVRPLSELRAGARRVMAGDFEHHIEPSGPADLRAVAAGRRGDAQRAGHSAGGRPDRAGVGDPPGGRPRCPGRRADAVQRRAGAVRLRGITRPAGAAAQGCLASASCWRSATATSSTSGAASTSTSPSTGPSGCRC